MNTYLEKAFEICGSQAELARQLKVTAQFVHKMAKSGHVPSEQCKKIEAATGGEVTAEQLRPDIFGSPSLS